MTDLFDSPEQPRRPLIASFNGVCAYGDWIESGEQIMFVDGEWAHTDCVERDSLVSPSMVCPKCRLVHATNQEGCE